MSNVSQEKGKDEASPVARSEQAGPDTMAARVRRKLTSRTASVVSIIIAIVLTIPTFGLFVSSLLPENDIKNTGWWTVFTNPSLTLQNYSQPSSEPKHLVASVADRQGQAEARP